MWWDNSFNVTSNHKRRVAASIVMRTLTRGGGSHNNNNIPPRHVCGAARQPHTPEPGVMLLWLIYNVILHLMN